MLRISNTLERFFSNNAHKRIVALLYLVIFATFFLSIKSGIGQYWDWSFPYFKSDMHNFFDGKSESWTSADTGSPLGYSTDFFLRFVISKVSFIPPEITRYTLMVLIFAAGAFGVYLLAKKRLSFTYSFLLGLAALINPAIFYKYTAGHFNYLIAYSAFIFLVYYLFSHLKKTIYSGVVIGLLVVLMGIQIQFFIISAIFLLTFALLNRDKLSIKIIAPAAIIPITVSLVWLCNFAIGAVNVADTSAAAAKVSVQGSTSTSFLNILTFNFSQATQLSKFYGFYELLLSATLLLILLWQLSQNRNKRTVNLTLLFFLVIMLFMSTGLFQKVHLEPFSSFYPMLREVGHFAPMVVLTLILVITSMVKKSTWLSGTIAFVALGLVLLSGFKFQQHSQAVNFSTARNSFSEFEDFTNKNPGNYRVLSYPFFDQYSFNFMKKAPQNELPLSNSGHDSFTIFSDVSFMQNAIPPYKFKDSPQYRITQDYNIDVLKPYGVKYIFNFSKIYESNYEKYVPPITYDANLKTIKNNPDFFSELLKHNPGKLRQINKDILEVVDYTPRFTASTQIFSTPSDTNKSAMTEFTSQVLSKPFIYIDSALKRSVNLTSLTSLFNNTEASSNTVSQKIDIPQGKTASLYEHSEQVSLSYKQSGDSISIISSMPGQLNINNKNASDGIDQKIIGRQVITTGGQYYVQYKGTITKVQPNKTEYLGIAKPNDTVQIFESKSANLLQDGSFEKNLWQPIVGDCNNYDKNPKIFMKQSSDMPFDGKSSLLLGAARHNACVSQQVSIQPDTSYFLSYSYRSDDAQYATAVVSYGDDSKSAKYNQAITDNSWHTSTTRILTPNNANKARIFLYAQEQPQTKSSFIANYYDDVSLISAKQVANISIPKPYETYIPIPISQDRTLDFSYKLDAQPIRNLVNNPSFERGNWQEKVGDCNQYDNKPNIGMSIDTTQGTDGKNSVMLSAKRHNACINTTANISGNTSYVISFDYKTNGAKQYGYAASFNDSDRTTIDDRFDAEKADSWHHARIEIDTPPEASTLTLYLYAFEGLTRTNTVWYDNVKVEELPATQDRFILVQSPTDPLKNLQQPDIQSYTQTSASMTVKHVSKPFFVLLSESYNPKWALQLPKTDKDNHFKVSSYGNGWYIDPQDICKNSNSLCSTNDDGSYNIEVIASFTAQKWFRVAETISAATLILSLLYVLVTPIRKKIVNRKENNNSSGLYKIKR